MSARGKGMGVVAWACSLVFLMSSSANAEQYELTESEVMDIAHFNTVDVALFGIKIGDSEAKVKENLIKIKIPGVKVEVQDVFVMLYDKRSPSNAMAGVRLYQRACVAGSSASGGGRRRSQPGEPRAATRRARSRVRDRQPAAAGGDRSRLHSTDPRSQPRFDRSTHASFVAASGPLEASAARFRRAACNVADSSRIIEEGESRRRHGHLCASRSRS
jgi:hypothetical protein